MGNLKTKIAVASAVVLITGNLANGATNNNINKISQLYDMTLKMENQRGRMDAQLLTEGPTVQNDFKGRAQQLIKEGVSDSTRGTYTQKASVLLKEISDYASANGMKINDVVPLSAITDICMKMIWTSVGGQPLNSKSIDLPQGIFDAIAAELTSNPNPQTSQKKRDVIQETIVLTCDQRATENYLGSFINGFAPTDYTYDVITERGGQKGYYTFNIIGGRICQKGYADEGAKFIEKQYNSKGLLNNTAYTGAQLSFFRNCMSLFNETAYNQDTQAGLDNVGKMFFDFMDKTFQKAQAIKNAGKKIDPTMREILDNYSKGAGIDIPSQIRNANINIVHELELGINNLIGNYVQTNANKLVSNMSIAYGSEERLIVPVKTQQSEVNNVTYNGFIPEMNKDAGAEWGAIFPAAAVQGVNQSIVQQLEIKYANIFTNVRNGRTSNLGLNDLLNFLSSSSNAYAGLLFPSATADQQNQIISLMKQDNLDAFNKLLGGYSIDQSGNVVLGKDGLLAQAGSRLPTDVLLKLIQGDLNNYNIISMDNVMSLSFSGFSQKALRQVGEWSSGIGTPAWNPFYMITAKNNFGKRNFYLLTDGEYQKLATDKFKEYGIEYSLLSPVSVISLGAMYNNYKPANKLTLSAGMDLYKVLGLNTGIGSLGIQGGRFETDFANSFLTMNLGLNTMGYKLNNPNSSVPLFALSLQPTVALGNKKTELNSVGLTGSLQYDNILAFNKLSMFAGASKDFKSDRITYNVGAEVYVMDEKLAFGVYSALIKNPITGNMMMNNIGISIKAGLFK